VEGDVLVEGGRGGLWNIRDKIIWQRAPSAKRRGFHTENITNTGTIWAYLAKVSGIKFSDNTLERTVSGMAKGISLTRRRVVLTSRTPSPLAIIPLATAAILSSTTLARVTITILRRIFRKMIFTKSAPKSAVRAVAQHQTVGESLVTRADGAGKLISKGADGGSFVGIFGSGA
jgi:hypothetical protein